MPSLQSSEARGDSARSLAAARRLCARSTKQPLAFPLRTPPRPRPLHRATTPPNAHCPSFCDDPRLLAISRLSLKKSARDGTNPATTRPRARPTLVWLSLHRHRHRHNLPRAIYRRAGTGPVRSGPQQSSRVQSPAAPKPAAHTHSLDDTSRVSSRQCASPLEQGSGRGSERRGEGPNSVPLPHSNLPSPSIRALFRPLAPPMQSPRDGHSAPCDR